MARRLGAQLLAGPPARDAVAAVLRLLAVQAQDPRGARLAVRARSRGVSAADIKRELSERRSLIITWLNRGTLHLVAAEDYHWLHALTTPPLHTAVARRLSQEGVTPAQAERALELIARGLADEGPLTRLQLRERLQRAAIPVGGQALVHLLAWATLHGVSVRGPMVGREHAYVLVRDWLGEPPPPVERPQALAELARRYLAGHGPADEHDLARWAGLPLRDARAGLQAIGSTLRELDGGLVELRTAPRDPPPPPPPRLLGAFEPVLLGWRSRASVVGEHEPRIISGGVFRPFALVEGRAAAVWRLDGRRGVEIQPFERLPRGVASALEADGRAVEAFLKTATR